MAVAHQAYMRYKSTAVQTAGPEQLLIMLYDGLIRAIQAGKLAISENRMDEAHKQLTKSQDIVFELRTTLKMEYEISHALSSLYEYFQRKLVEANIKKATEPLEEILPRIQELREAWSQAALQLRQSSGAE